MIVIMLPLLELLLSRLHGRECAFAAGEFLFHSDDTVRLLHFVRRGTVHLVRYQSDGAALSLQRARQGSILAEASLYSARYHCDGRAETSTITWAASRNEVRKQLANSPDISEAWASHLAAEVQRARLHAEILSLKTIAARLKAWIAWNGSLPGRGQWLAIALEIGVSPEALYREIAIWRRDRGLNPGQKS
jgi:CRP-like cAMP-binding protein